MTEAQDPSELKNEGYEIFIAALAILSIVNLVLLYTVEDAALDNVLWVVNILLTFIFLGDFAYRMKTARSRSRYFWKEYGWADLLSCLPFQQVKVFRLFRLIKVYRLLKEKGAKAIGKAIVGDRAGSALLTLIVVAILMFEFGSLGMLKIEGPVPGANITNASDSMWYTIVTMSTVGYGDRYPITNPGRILGVIIIIIGVGIFGTLTGYLANAFLTPRKPKPEAEEPAEPTTPAQELEARLAALREAADQQQAAVDEQRAAIAALEEMIGKGA